MVLYNGIPLFLKHICMNELYLQNEVYTDLEDKRTSFKEELTALLNRFSKELPSNTPDYVLAEYLVGCLDLYNNTVYARHKSKGHE